MDRVLDRLVTGLRQIYNGDLQSVILYGSVARGTATPESDVDVAVIVKYDDPSLHDKMIDFVVDLELESGKVLSVLVINKGDYQEWEDISPFYRNIRREGIILWNIA